MGHVQNHSRCYRDYRASGGMRFGGDERAC
jgi:hypothetical protein